jgi:ABC-2 type transport system permease protein
MVYSAMGILFASIPTASPGEVIIPLNFVRIPLMFVSGMFIPLEKMPAIGITAAFLSPLTHTIDLIKQGTGSTSFFGIGQNISILLLWLILFFYIGQTFHKIIMKRE